MKANGMIAMKAFHCFSPIRFINHIKQMVFRSRHNTQTLLISFTSATLITWRERMERTDEGNEK